MKKYRVQRVITFVETFEDIVSAESEDDALDQGCSMDNPINKEVVEDVTEVIE